MAIDQINATGGVGGQKIEWTRYPTDMTNIPQTLSNYLQASGSSPTAVLGVGETDQVQALEADIQRAQIPFFQLTGSDDSIRYGYTGNSEYVWGIQPDNDLVVKAHVEFAVKDVGIKHPGLLCSDETYGIDACALAKQYLAALGIKPFAEELYPVTATDLTPQVLAMKGADGVLHFGYPSQEGIQLAEFQQNGLDIPTVMDSSFPYAIAGGGITGAELAKVTDVVPACDVEASGGGVGLKAFYAAYEKMWHAMPDPYSYEAYDYVYLIKAAIEAGKSAAPTAVNAELSKITVTPAQGIVCFPSLHSDGSHFLGHLVSVLKYASNGSATVLQTITTPGTPAASGAPPT